MVSIIIPIYNTDRYLQQAMDSVEKFHLGDSAYEALRNRKALSLIGLGLNEISSESSFWKRAKKIKALLSLFWLKSALKQLPLNYLTPP